MAPIDKDFRWPLLDREELIWSGQPAKGLLLGPRDVFLIPFSLMWGGFAVFWEAAVFRSGAPLLFRFWGIPFLLIGVYLIAGRFIVDAYLRAKTRYALTSERVLIARASPFRKFVAVNLVTMPQAQLNERAGGRGTIRFSGLTPFWGRTGGWAIWSPELDSTPQFINIEDARSVFDNIQRATRKTAAR